MTPAEHISAALCLLEHVRHVDESASIDLTDALHDILRAIDAKTEAVSITLPVLPLATVTKIRDEIATAVDLIVPLASVDDFRNPKNAPLMAKCERITDAINRISFSINRLGRVAGARAVA